MEITVEQAQGRVPVAIMQLEGALDASTFQHPIARAKELYEAGTRHLLIDLNKVPFMSSSGLVALHSIILIMSGETLPDTDYGWGALRAMASDVQTGRETPCKFLNPQPPVIRTLEMTGFKSILEIYTDRELAVASF
jgi:anti-anti-sigma regulatory factor